MRWSGHCASGPDWQAYALADSVAHRVAYSFSNGFTDCQAYAFADEKTDEEAYALAHSVAHRVAYSFSNGFTDCQAYDFADEEAYAFADEEAYAFADSIVICFADIDAHRLSDSISHYRANIHRTPLDPGTDHVTHVCKRYY